MNSNRTNPQVEKLLKRIPASSPGTLSSTMDYYGALKCVQRYCSAPNTTFGWSIGWQHGWCRVERQSIDPRLVVLESDLQHGKTYLVARDDEVSYLQGHGLRSIAVGLPIVYAETSGTIERISNSLLVMPAHSLDYTTHDWKFAEYAKQIAELQQSFDVVAVCIHPSCVRHGYWVKEFAALGMPIIHGAEASDMNGLERMATLMKSFTHVTTNTLGSQVPYASAFGAKVSIWGTYAETRSQDFSNAPFYQANPHILERIVESFSIARLRQQYSWLFRHPCDAADNEAWGKREIGWQNKKSPEELTRCLGWDRSASVRICLRSWDRIQNKMRRAASKIIYGKPYVSR